MIDYRLIAEAVDYYEDRGYSRIESPWMVSRAISDLTKPVGCSTYSVKKETRVGEKVFVASGEQSLLYLISKGNLPKSGKFLTVTPCLRDDPWDETHWKTFMKLELIRYGDYVSNMTVGEVADDAFSFFSRCVDPVRLKMTDVPVSPMLDIELDEVEVGSYGIRECSFAKWVYGTGLAEPRFSRMLRRTE